MRTRLSIPAAVRPGQPCGVAANGMAGDEDAQPLVVCTLILLLQKNLLLYEREIQG